MVVKMELAVSGHSFKYQFGDKHAKENQPCLNHLPVGILVLVRCMALRDN